MGGGQKSLCNHFQVLCHQTGIIRPALHAHSLTYCWVCILQLQRYDAALSYDAAVLAVMYPRLRLSECRTED